MLTTTKMMMMMMMMETATVTSFSSPHPRPVLRHPAASSSSRRRLRRILSPTSASAAAAIDRCRCGVGPEVDPTDGCRRRTRTATVDWRCYRAPMSFSRHDESLSRDIRQSIHSFPLLHVQHQTQQTSPRAQLQGTATWRIQWHDSTAIAVYMLTVS